MTDGIHISDDRRVKRTQKLIFEAFADLVQSRRFDEIRTLDIIECAGVGKSTFYEHFRDKSDVLQQSLRGPFAIIADALTGSENPNSLKEILDHFWDNLTFGRVILRHPTRSVVEECLRGLIIRRIEKSDGDETEAERSARATFLAAGFIALLTDWLTGKVAVKTAQFTNIVTRLATI